MKKELNISEILKNKPKGTRLYSPIFGECVFSFIQNTTNDVCVKKHNGEKAFFDYKGLYNTLGECLLFPSREMHNWRKFAWKKGDLLINSCGFQCIFKEWASDDYTKFNGCYSNSRDGYEDVSNAETAKFVKLDNNIAYGYVREIERKLDGKLNLETLEVEKAQPEFKDGDIVVAEGENKGKKIFIFRYKIRDSNTDEHGYKSYINVNSDGSLFNNMTFYLRKDFVYRLATDSEKQQLFDALAKEGKRWNAGKKMIIDLKPKVELKPFDKVLCRNSKDDTWEADFFARLTREEIDYTQSGKYLCVGDLWMYCIPYNEETAHLLGTTDEWKGGEG